MTPDEVREEFAKHPYDGRKIIKVEFATLSRLLQLAVMPNSVRARLVKSVLDQLTP